MRTTFAVFVLVSIIATTLAWRSQPTGTGRESGITIGERGGPKRIADKERHKTTEPKQQEPVQHFNIGLIVPHTNFGKREYARAINTAITSLQKMRDTKLQFLHDYEFTAKNVHFDMILLTPSPTSECAKDDGIDNSISAIYSIIIIFLCLSHPFR